MVNGTYAFIARHVHMRYLQLTRVDSSGVCNERIAISKSPTVHDIHSDGQTLSLGAPRVYAILFEPVVGVHNYALGRVPAGTYFSHKTSVA